MDFSRSEYGTAGKLHRHGTNCACEEKYPTHGKTQHLERLVLESNDAFRNTCNAVVFHFRRKTITGGQNYDGKFSKRKSLCLFW